MSIRPARTKPEHHRELHVAAGEFRNYIVASSGAGWHAQCNVQRDRTEQEIADRPPLGELRQRSSAPQMNGTETRRAAVTFDCEKTVAAQSLSVAAVICLLTIRHARKKQGIKQSLT